MFFLRIFRRMFLLVLALTGLTIAVQISYFFTLGSNNKDLHETDVIIAFPGEKEREDALWSLADRGLAPNIVIINSTANRLKNKSVKYQIDEQINLLEGGKSRSTFEDVYMAANIILEHNYKSILLVTSFYHMPRSLFLFKVYLLSLGVKVDLQYFTAITGKNKNFKTKTGIYYNEIIKMWGSTFELLGNLVTKKLMNDSSRFRKTRRFIHKYLIYGC